MLSPKHPRQKIFFSLFCVVLIAAGCQKPASNNNPITTNTPANSSINTQAMTITSPAFEANGTIPMKYTCEGENINPPLAFADVPKEAKSLVMLMDDPDVPTNLKPDGMFDHWVVFNMPPSTTSIAENSTPPGMQGQNGRGNSSYTGPCPPDREHRYFFKLYALDTELQLNEPIKAEVETAMQGHIIAQAELIGRYDKKNK